MSDALALRAPAKLNLGLRVLGRRPDGFHELETIFVAIDLCDELCATRRAEPGVGLRLIAEQQGGLPVVAGDDNLVVRAAGAFLARSGAEGGYDVVLRKRIPAGGGLGGGSADAAAMLCLAQSLCGAPLSEAALAEIALALGADVPFFLRGPFCDAVTCFARGVGEQLWPMPDQPPRHFVLVLPPFGTPTKAVFHALASRLTETVAPAMVRATETPTASEFAVIEAGGNQLEEPAMQCTPGLRDLRQSLVASLEGEDVRVRMSGSGSTLFVESASAAQADRIAVRIQAALARRPDPGGAVRVLRANALAAPLRPGRVAWSSRDQG